MDRLVGYNALVYVDGLEVGCVQNYTFNTNQAVNLIAHKGLRNVKGNTYDQISEQEGTLNLTGLFLADESNITDFSTWQTEKLERQVEIRDTKDIGSRTIKFNARLQDKNETDEGLLSYDLTLQTSGEIVYGTLQNPPLFIFTTNKIGEIDIQTSGTQTWTDGNGTPIPMPWTRNEGDSPFIYMYGDALNTLTSLDAPLCGLIGDYDLSGWTSLQDADLSGNSMESLTTIDGQFNTGTLDVTNSFIEGQRFTDFIIEFDTNMITPRASNLLVGSIDDPLLLDPGDTTGTYAAIQSLIVKLWNVSVTSSKMLTFTIAQSGFITPNASFSGTGNVAFVRNGETIGSVNNTSPSLGNLNVFVGDSIDVYFANGLGTIANLNSLLLNSCFIEFIFVEQFLNESTVKVFCQRNLFQLSTVNIIKSALDTSISNGDSYNSNMIFDINSLQVGNLYTSPLDYYNNIIDYINSDRLICYRFKAEISANYSGSFFQEGNFIIPSEDQVIIDLLNDSIKNTIEIYGSITGRLDIRNNPNLYEFLLFSETLILTQNIRADNSSINGVLDLSRTEITVPRLTFTNNPITNVLFNSIVNVNTWLWFFNCDITGVFDLSNVNYSGINLALYNNPNMTGLILKDGITLNDFFQIQDCNIDGVLDLTNVTFNLTDCRLNGNPNFTEFKVSAASNLGTITKDPQTVITYV